jgi:hypothetical protein
MFTVLMQRLSFSSPSCISAATAARRGEMPLSVHFVQLWNLNVQIQVGGVIKPVISLTSFTLPDGLQLLKVCGCSFFCARQIAWLVVVAGPYKRHCLSNAWLN